MASAFQQHQLRDGPSARLIVVKVHEIPDVSVLLEETFVSGIQEISTEPESVF